MSGLSVTASARHFRNGNVGLYVRDFSSSKDPPRAARSRVDAYYGTMRESLHHPRTTRDPLVTSAMNENSSVSISVVVPVYLGANYVSHLVNELASVREEWAIRDAPMRLEEVIFVDDCAVDDSPRIIDQLSNERSWITGIHLMRNFGQHAATIAGILHSSGDWIVTLDEDLQHPPEMIELLIRRMAETGADIVYAQPRSGVHKARHEIGHHVSLNA